MSSRKERKKQRQKSSVTRQKMLQELKHCKEIAKELEEQVEKDRKERKKQIHIRNLKVFKSTCKFVAPIVLTTGITVGAFHLLGFGLPIHLDKEVRYKTCSFDYITNGNVSMEESYGSFKWYNDPLPESIMTIYTPWEKSGNEYVRYKRTYELEQLKSMDLINAVLNKDYEYIENIETYFEEKQVINCIEQKKNNDYEVKAKLYILNKKDKLYYDENSIKNIIVTVIELVVSFGVSVYAMRKVNYRYLDHIKEINNNYLETLNEYEETEHELVELRKKIMSLSKQVRR